MALSGIEQPVLIAPSILSADFGRLADQLTACEKGGADWIHCDVMDGHFVPNITFGPFIVEAAKKSVSLPLDVHLMIENPDLYIPDFVKAGASWITVHQETVPHLHRTVQLIRSLGVHPGVSVNPATPVSVLEEILPYIDMVLIMSVNPGFGGQKFIDTSLKKIQKLRKMAEHLNPALLIEVDGGVSPETALPIVKSGANILVAGSAVFRYPDPADGIRKLRESLEERKASLL
ncbi:MAG: ribulose-phosphate 3-epimerase [Bacteroidetes bacterium]|nr:ribulose-phosphate 3-epimerase [Bacteroidota bacterium]